MMTTQRLPASIAMAMLAASINVGAIALNATTAAIFDQYVRLTERRIAGEIAAPGPFIWIDGLAPRRRAELDNGLRQGGVVIERLQTRDGTRSIEAPDALIHHWIGLVFVPGVDVDEAVALMQDYGRHAAIFTPNITRSKTLHHDGQKYRVALRFYVKKVIGVTMDTENEAEFFRTGVDRAHSRIRSTRVTEIAEAGTQSEHEKPAGQENGFMWRLNTYWRFLERDGGTYVQCESLTLSRDVPFALGWIIRPFVTQVPKESLTFTLERIKRALAGAGRSQG